jgi:hypothetical protein
VTDVLNRMRRSRLTRDVAGTDFANFVGYILWSIWLLAFAILIWRRSDIGDPAAPQLAT